MRDTIRKALAARHKLFRRKRQLSKIEQLVQEFVLADDPLISHLTSWEEGLTVQTDVTAQAEDIVQTHEQVPEPVDISAEILRAVNAVLACDRMLFSHQTHRACCVLHLTAKTLALYWKSAIFLNHAQTIHRIAYVSTVPDDQPNKVVCGIITRELGSNFCTVG